MLFTICLLHFVAQLSPGPDVLLIAKSAASTSRVNALKVAAGISCGVILWVILTLAGFSLLLERLPWIQQILMCLGALFLAKMGWAMLKAGWFAFQQRSAGVFDDRQVEPVKNYFLLGFLTNLANPKILIYFSSVFSLALSSTAAPDLKLQLAFLIPLQTFLTFTVLMYLISLPKIKQIYQRSGAYIDMISGGLFLVFALWLCYDAVFLL